MLRGIDSIPRSWSVTLVAPYECCCSNACVAAATAAAATTDTTIASHRGIELIDSFVSINYYRTVTLIVTVK